MSSWDFIVDNIRYSYSSVSSFETCRGGWKLYYIDKRDTIDNFFSQYGRLIHTCFEKYFMGEMETFEISEFYEENYSQYVTATPPAYPKGMGENYRTQGKDYFDKFFFERWKYDILSIEDSAYFDLEIEGRHVKFIAKPDLLLKERATQKTSLIDFKTANPFKKSTHKLTEDKRKTEGYYKQLYTYVHAIRETTGHKIDKISLWFPRVDTILTVDCNDEDEAVALDWLRGGIERILKEEEFPFDNSNAYFCTNLCGTRHHCPLFGGK